MAATILVIEPTESLIAAITSLIEGSGLNVVWAYDQATARDFLSRHGVSTIVVNVDEHRDEELALIETVRKNRRHHQAHIIAISKHTDVESLRQTLNAGADDYMSSPVLPQELRGRFSWAATVSNRHR
jgi:DNA-binding response OmpR family regulator